ncbi:hypothetical protein [Thiorhodococcus fuscus]|uniref:SGNH/GDSL hydrolase family protein n=1 Tax=Thiorhodococcus fuscus TaxID=527200 RepID=A0ABW4Y8N7_9GAMM
MARKLFLYGFLVLFLLGTIELMSFGVFRLFQDRFTFLDTELYRLPKADLPLAEQHFDARLGWSEHYSTPQGERPLARAYGKALVSAYGDSYTHCDEVEDDQTWETFLADETGSDVFNYGVGGFGTGQAYLRFKDEFPAHRTPVVTLGLITENINRTVNVYRPYYYPGTQLHFTKPRFIQRDGELALLENPIQDKSDLPNLMDDAFLRSAGKHDWWFNRDEYPVLGFPYSAILLNQRIWKEAISGKMERPVTDMNPRPWAELWEQEEPRSLMFAIFDRFFVDAREQEARPLLLVLPQREEVQEMLRTGRLPSAVRHIIDHCEAGSLDCIEMVSLFAKHVQTNGPESLDGLFLRAHVSPEGNRLIAQRIAVWLRDRNLIDP